MVAACLNVQIKQSYNNVIITISRHIENPSIVRTVYSGTSLHILGHSVTLSHVQALLRRMEPLSETFGTLRNHCIYNRAIFRTLAYLEPKATSKDCQTCKMIRDIDAYSLQPHSQALIKVCVCVCVLGGGGGGLGGLPCPS